MLILALLVALCSASQLNADFSLQNIVSYVAPKTQEEIDNYDHAFAANGTLELENTNGNIIIKTWNQEKIVIEATKKGKEADLDNIDIDAQITEHYAHLSTKQTNKNKSTVDYTVIVPKKVTLKVKTLNGSITASNIEGSINATTTKGSITITDASNAVRAKTTNGTIEATLRHVKPATAIELENQNGDINLAIPNNTNADLFAKTADGKISCDLYVTTKPRITKINNQFWDTVQREVEGSLGHHATASLRLQTNRGDVDISEY